MKRKKKRESKKERGRITRFVSFEKKKKWVNRVKILDEVATSLALNVLLRKKVLSQQVLLPRYTRWIAKRSQLKFIIYLNYLNVQKLTFVSCVVLLAKRKDDQKAEFIDRILLCEDLLLRRLHVTSCYVYDVNDW